VTGHDPDARAGFQKRRNTILEDNPNTPENARVDDAVVETTGRATVTGASLFGSSAGLSRLLLLCVKLAASPASTSQR